MLPPAKRPWIPIGTSILLIATALMGAVVAAVPAQATVTPAPGTPCVVAGGISSDDSFNAAVDQVNAGICNLIQIDDSITFNGTIPTAIYDDPLDDTVIPYVAIEGPPNPDDSVINGNGGQGLSIDVTTNLTLTVSGITFTNFDDTIGPWQSALAVAASNLTASFNNVAFIGNDGGVMAGGLHIDAFPGTATTTMTGRVTFTDNTSASHEAGALWADDSYSTLTIGTSGADDTITFARNTSKGWSGGSIVGETITVYGGTFTDDSAALTGGSIYATGDVTLNDSDFTANTASGNGGGAVHALGAITVNGGTFHNNDAPRPPSPSVAGGGALWAGGPIDSEGVAYTGNTAGGAGGAIYAVGPLTLTNSVFEDDTASDGGAIRARDSLAVVSSAFRRNVALLTGGAIVVDDTATIVNSVFQSNEAQGDPTVGGGAGGALQANGGARVSGSTFESNTASGGGGAVSIAGDTWLTDDTFTGNQSLNQAGGGDGGGGAVFVRASTPDMARVTGTTFMDNESALDGGAIQIDGSVTIANSTFSQNEADNNGGAVSAASTTTIEGSTFTDNSASLGA